MSSAWAADKRPAACTAAPTPAHVRLTTPGVCCGAIRQQRAGPRHAVHHFEQRARQECMRLDVKVLDRSSVQASSRAPPSLIQMLVHPHASPAPQLASRAVKQVMGRGWAQQAFSSKAAKQRPDARVHGKLPNMVRLAAAAGKPSACIQRPKPTNVSLIQSAAVHHAIKRYQWRARRSGMSNIALKLAPTTLSATLWLQTSPASQSSNAEAPAASSHRSHQRRSTLRARAACCRA